LQLVYINARFLTQQITGVQQFAHEVCRNLQQHNNVTYTLLVPPKTLIPDYLSHLNALEIGNTSGYLWEQVELPLFLYQKKSPLLVNFCNTAPAFYNNQWVTIHDLAFMHHPEWFSKSFSIIYRLLVPRLLTKSKRIFTVSNTIAQQIKKLFNKNAEVLKNGIPEALIHFLQHKPASQREKIILTVASRNPRKNVKTLIDAFTKANLYNYQLVIVGAFNAVFAPDGLTSANNIIFTGYLPDDELYKWYCKASLFISLSHDEGFGIPVLEAVACGCTVLLSDIETYRECFESVGLFTNQCNSDIVAKDLEQALNHSLDKVKVSQLIKQYNYADTAKKFHHLIYQAVKKL
jgi:glycosyltransferase involved in cell wall biosynthesis